MGQDRRESGSGAKERKRPRCLQALLYPLYGMVLPFLEMGHTLGKLNQRLEFRGPLR